MDGHGLTCGRGFNTARELSFGPDLGLRTKAAEHNTTTTGAEAREKRTPNAALKAPLFHVTAGVHVTAGTSLQASVA